MNPIHKSIFFKKKYTKENIFWRRKSAVTPKIIGAFYPKSNLTYIL